ncbi:MAG TPA: PEGA domain-containing protein [Syntrophorhabdaceae bacterium]|jgi:hypothetical protein
MIARNLILLLFCAALAVGCGTSILRQDIPVTTNPMGAKIYANGKDMGKTPATVSLERTREHVITIVKEGYRQEDVAIRKQYQSDKVFMKALQTGFNTQIVSKDNHMAVNSGFNSVTQQEQTGEAYTLVPPVIKITLTPNSAPPAVNSGSERTSQILPPEPSPPE